MPSAEFFKQKGAIDMMNIVGLDIEINRGNAAGLTLHFAGEDVPLDGTIVKFEVRDADYYNLTMFEKEIPIHDQMITIDFLPEDTNNIKPGEYYWNACIQYADGEEPWTLMRDWAKFIVLPG